MKSSQQVSKFKALYEHHVHKLGISQDCAAIQEVEHVIAGVITVPYVIAGVITVP